MRRLFALFSLLPALAVISPAPSYAQLISIVIAPPILPVYVQPAIPAPGYIWTPGYWAYGPDGYFWVPGTWVEPPSVGLLWTPGYWGWNDGVYAWNGGYWGPTVGFYGGVNYGYGYGGVGFGGGYWRGGVFSYNRSVNNFGGVNITNVYSKTVIVNNNRVAFNGGAGGIAARPTPVEMAAMHEQHIAATAAQAQHEHTASTTRENLASVNHGAPAVAATSKAGVFSGNGVVGAHGAVTPAAGGLARGPGSTNPLGNAAALKGPGTVPNAAPKGPGTPSNAANTAPKGPGTPSNFANTAPKGPANTLATGGPAPGANSPTRPTNPGGTATGTTNPPRSPGGPTTPAAGAPARAAAVPHPAAAGPRGPAAPRPPAGRPAANGNHKPG
jgi:WXXGXW repeat (2 copies)